MPELSGRKVTLLVAGLVIAVACAGGTAETSSSTSSPTGTSPTSTTTMVLATSHGTVDAMLVLGDWGSGTPSQEAVAEAMSRYADEHAVAAVLTTGDNFYTDDTETLMRPISWATTAGIPFWITWGNHDVESQGRIGQLDEAFDSPPRWAVYGWGLIDVVVLDSNQIDTDEQLEFLDDAISDSTRPTVVAFHHPVYSCGLYGPDEDILDQWVTLFDDDVFLVLNGHDHNYQRFESGDTTFIVTGGGGERIYPVGACAGANPEIGSSAELHHFLAMTQTDTTVVVEVISVTGEVIDEVRLPLP